MREFAGRIRVHEYGPIVLQLVAIALFIVAASTSDVVVLRALDLAAAFALASVAAFMLGRRSAYASIEQQMSWLPKSVHLHEDDDGTKHALVERISGDVVTLTIPDEIDSNEAAMRWVIDELMSE